MIDKIAIILTHVLMALAAWRLMSRDDLDPPRPQRRGLHKQLSGPQTLADAPQANGQSDA